jgi:hypothetical protein
MNPWESTFLNFDAGLVEERIWRTIDAWYSSLLERGPGYKRWWEMTKHGYDPSFQRHVDRVFEHLR